MVAHREVEHTRCAPAAQFNIAALVAAHGHTLVRQIGHRLQQVVQFGLNHLKPRGRRIQLGLEGAHLRHHGIGAFPLGFELTDLFGEGVALALQLFSAGLQRLALRLQGLVGGHIQKRLWALARFKPRHDPGEVFSQLNDV
ncbi:hypothetical protein FQZ97_878360 [compost metagenome]